MECSLNWTEIHCPFCHSNRSLRYCEKFTPQGRGLGLMRPRLELGEKSHWWDPCLFPAGLWESRARPGRTLAGNVITLASRRGDSRFSHIRTSCSEWVPGSERYLGFKGSEASFKFLKGTTYSLHHSHSSWQSPLDLSLSFLCHSISLPWSPRASSWLGPSWAPWGHLLPYCLTCTIRPL